MKWVMVGVLSVVLLGVWYFSLRPSAGEKTGFAAPAEPGEELNPDISAIANVQPVATQEAVPSDPETTATMSPPMIQNIFSFSSRKDHPTSRPVGTPEEKAFVLKGTIMDGEKSLAYINDEMIGLGESINDFTLIDISIDSATIKNGDEVITLLEKEDAIDETL